MFLDELEVLLDGRGVLVFDELPQGTQVIGAMPLGDLAGPLHNGSRLLAGQRQQAHQYAHAFDAAMLEHRPRPPRGVWADLLDPPQEPGCAPLNAADLLRQEMNIERGERPRRTLRVQRNRTHLLVEQPNGAPIPARPDPLAQKLRRN